MRQWKSASCAVGIGLAIVGVLRLPFLSDQAVSFVSDLGQLVAAMAACAGSAVAARRTPGQLGRAWAWLSAGTGCWAAGQAVWSWYELVLDREVPFPSLADAGFLLSPVAMAIGLVIWLGSQSEQLAARGRDLLDGAIIATSLLAISWVTTLGSVASAGAESWLPLVLSLAYPIGDIILATFVLLALARSDRRERAVLIVLGLGLGGLACADSSYVYLTQIGSYSSASVVSVGWVVGFLLVGAAGVSTSREQTATAVAESGPRRPARLLDSSPLQMALPYVPLVTAGAVLVMTLLRSATTPAADLLFGVSLVVLMLGRQFLALLDNRRLLQALGVARDQMQHQASHDALTGLANRSLFATRLHEVLAESTADVSVLFCDLDDFKLVNDRYGHDVGDELLVIVGQRLLQCVRSGDTVARLGGDEFAVLVESDQAAVVAERVVQLLAQPVELRGLVLATSASVGIAHHRIVAAAGAPDRPAALTARAAGVPELRVRAEREALATLLLRAADTAMYAAKSAGKGRVVMATPRLAPAPPAEPRPAEPQPGQPLLADFPMADLPVAEFPLAESPMAGSPMAGSPLADSASA